MFMVHKPLPKKMKTKKIMQFPTIKSPPFSYGSDFFLKNKKIIMHLLQK
jgi:hypothetical protein